jgi:hypothetical protein
LRFTRRVRRTRQGDFELRLPAEEREMLRSLPAQMREALAADHDDPAVARLNPTAYLEDPEYDEEFRRFMGGELTAGRMEALQALEDSVDARRLDETQALAWLRAINDVRLLLGVRLDVTEDPADRQVAPDDPRAPGLALYDYLSLLQQDLVEALGES